MGGTRGYPTEEKPPKPVLTSAVAARHWETFPGPGRRDVRVSRHQGARPGLHRLTHLAAKRWLLPPRNRANRHSARRVEASHRAFAAEPNGKGVQSGDCQPISSGWSIWFAVWRQGQYRFLHGNGTCQRSVSGLSHGVSARVASFLAIQQQRTAGASLERDLEIC